MPKKPVSYAVEQRLRLIDFLLVHYGRLNRAALEDYFGISTPQASLDIQAYIEMAPSNIIYDKSEKTYKVTELFTRVYA